MSNLGQCCFACNVKRWHAWRVAHSDWMPATTQLSMLRQEQKVEQQGLVGAISFLRMVSGWKGVDLVQAVKLVLDGADAVDALKTVRGL